MTLATYRAAGSRPQERGVDGHDVKYSAAISFAMTFPPIADLLRLDGEVALVTGGSTGIGRRIVERLIEAGATVHVVDLAIPSDAADLRGVTWHEGDVRDGDLATEICDHIDGLSIVVNNAGVYHLAHVDDISDELWSLHLDVNLAGTLRYARAAAKKMGASGTQGRIVNMSSTTALKTTPLLAHYGAAKAAVAHLTRSLAVEYGGLGIRVNAIAPGGIPTARARQIGVEAHALGRANLDNRPRPLGDIGTPDDIACAVLYLVGPMSRYVTGALLVVDGGVTLV
jgi:NAD(P)-dependent dehydrogenase (short-subunit alcohol dehydrogenase family)